jgi:ComF family protein
MYQLITHLKHLILPTFCAYCKIFFKDAAYILCRDCRAAIRPVVSHQLAVTKTKSITVHAVGAYDQPLVSLILAKSRGNRTVAHQLGKLAWQQTAVPHLQYDYITPIPLHWTRYAWRGYNQADEIARVIARKSGRPVAHLLKRKKRTPFQSHFRGDAREQNVADAFALQKLDASLYKDKHLLLVDDVMTSGATLKQAAKELYRLQPASITAVVISRVA